MTTDLATKTGSLEDAIADLGMGSYITSAKGCRPGFDQTIHISKPQDRRLGKVCDAIRGGGTILVELEEEAPLETMAPSVETLADLFGRPGSLLIHCVAGINRAPTLAALALFVRGMKLEVAIDQVYRCNREQRGIDSRIFPAPMKSLHDFAFRKGRP